MIGRINHIAIAVPDVTALANHAGCHGQRRADTA
jgi:hypothetical protein